MDITPEGLLVAIGWAVSLTVAIIFAFRVIPEMAARRICKMFGLTRVRVGDREIYAVEDLNREPVKIPVGVKEVDGEQQVQYGYAPLPITMTFLAAEQAAMKVKMTLFNAKSQISKKMQKEGMTQALQEGGSLEQILPFLPKKAQMAAALLRAAGLGGGVAPQGGQNSPSSRVGGGGKAI